MTAGSESGRSGFGECEHPVCVTCSDEGRLVEVVEAPASLLDRATVRSPDGIEAVDVTLVGVVSPGDLLLVHAGTALTRVDGHDA